MINNKLLLSVFSALISMLLVTSTTSASQLNIAFDADFTDQDEMTDGNSPAADQRGISFSQNSNCGIRTNTDVTYFYDDFESYAENSYPSNFTQIYNGCGDAEQKVITTTGYDGANSKVFRLLGCNGWASEQYVSLPSQLPAILVIDAYVKPVSGSVPGALRSRNPSGTWGTTISDVTFDTGGNITAGGIVIGAYTAGSWYRVTMEHDITQKIYNVYINGIKAAENINMHPTLSPTQLEVVGGNNGTNEIYFDNVGLYETPMNLFQCTPPPSGMVSWWGGDNNALDMVGGNHGTLMGGATYASGMVGEAFSFDGVNDYVEIPHSASLNLTSGLTLDTWFKANTAGDGTLFSKSDSNGSESVTSYALAINPDGSFNMVLYGTYPADNWVTAPGLFTIGQWYHVALTWDGTYGPVDNVKLYLNGALVESRTKSSAPLHVTTQSLTLGSMKPPEQYRRLDGLMDEPEIFNRALSADEIAAIYNAGSAGKCRSCTPAPANIVSWWDAEGNADDIIGTNNGTLMNGATFASGMVGQAFSLDGVDDYVLVPDAPNLNFASTSPLTIYMWAYLTDSDATHLIGKRATCWDSGQSANYQISYDSTNGFAFNSGGTQLVSGQQILTNQWHHIAVTADGSTFRIYVNGQEKGFVAGTLGGQNNVPLTIGDVCPGVTDPFHGFLDEVTIVNRALTADEIAAIYNAGGAGNCKIDTIPPTVVSVIRADPNPTNAVSVDFTVTFSENVTGVDTADFAPTKTGTIAGESVETVNGGPIVYTVTVNTGSGDGTLRLDAIDDDTILDLASNPLGGIGLGNGDFTTGETYDINKTAPTVTMTSLTSDPTNDSPIAVTVQFSETVTGFDASDIVPGNGTVSNFMTVDGDTYTFDLTPSSQGLVTADIAEGVASDSAGNGNTAAIQFSRIYNPIYNLFLPLLLR